MTFEVDSEEFIDFDPGHDRGYLILNDAFTITAGDAILEGITGTHYIHITNDYWVVDGVHWFEENIGYGYWHEFELWGNNGEMFDSTDITECAGEYGPGLFADTSWHINLAFIVSFGLLTIHDASTSIDHKPPTSELSMLTVHPTPFRHTVQLGFESPAGEMSHLLVLDAMGRLIRSFPIDSHSRGVTWHARDNSGRPVGAGTYFIRLETERGVDTEKVLLIR